MNKLALAWPNFYVCNKCGNEGHKYQRCACWVKKPDKFIKSTKKEVIFFNIAWVWVKWQSDQEYYDAIKYFPETIIPLSPNPFQCIAKSPEGRIYNLTHVNHIGSHSDTTFMWEAGFWESDGDEYEINWAGNIYDDEFFYTREEMKNKGRINED